MPRCCSIFIQSERARARCAARLDLAGRVDRARRGSSSFSVSVVLPASGCEMIAKVRRSSVSLSGFRAALLISSPGRRARARLKGLVRRVRRPDRSCGGKSVGLRCESAVESEEQDVRHPLHPDPRRDLPRLGGDHLGRRRQALRHDRRACRALRPRRGAGRIDPARHRHQSARDRDHRQRRAGTGDLAIAVGNILGGIAIQTVVLVLSTPSE